MRRVSSADFQRNFSALSDAALNEPLLISRHERDSLRSFMFGLLLRRQINAQSPHYVHIAPFRGSVLKERHLYNAAYGP